MAKDNDRRTANEPPTAVGEELVRKEELNGKEATAQAGQAGEAAARLLLEEFWAAAAPVMPERPC